jgi:C2H2-type zinc finger
MERRGNTEKMHPCQFCDQVFVSAQALGGHQNCHRHERELMKKAKEHQQQLSMLAPHMSRPLLPPTVPTYHYHPNFSNHQNLLGGVSRFHGPTYVPNRRVPNEYYSQPSAHQQQARPMKNFYFGMRNHSNNPFQTPVGNATLFPRHHAGFSSYYEGMPMQKKPRYEPQIYDFFAHDGEGMSTTKIVNQAETNPPSSIIEGENAKEAGRTMAGPSVALTMKHTDEKASDNKDGNDETCTELDLTFRL